MLTLVLTRGLDASRAALRRESPYDRANGHTERPACPDVTGLAGLTIGLVGLGQVGALVARYLQPFGATVLYTRRNRDRAAESDLGITYATLDELVSKSDVLPSRAGKRANQQDDQCRIAGPREAGHVHRQYVQGSIIDEEALVTALKDGTIGGAALDVFTSEPLRSDHPLHGLENVILTPHVAAGTRDEDGLTRNRTSRRLCRIRPEQTLAPAVACHRQNSCWLTKSSRSGRAAIATTLCRTSRRKHQAPHCRHCRVRAWLGWPCRRRQRQGCCIRVICRHADALDSFPRRPPLRALHCQRNGGTRSRIRDFHLESALHSSSPVIAEAFLSRMYTNVRDAGSSLRWPLATS